MEVACIRRTYVYHAINTSAYFISSKLIVFITFVVYVLNGNILTAEKVIDLNYVGPHAIKLSNFFKILFNMQ